MSIREFPKTDNQQEHLEWVTSATEEELDAYIPYYSGTPTFHRMGTAQREKLWAERKSESNNTATQFPGTITLKWLWEYLPVHYIAWFFGLLFSAFLAGLYIADTDLYKKHIKSLINNGTAISQKNTAAIEPKKKVDITK